MPLHLDRALPMSFAPELTHVLANCQRCLQGLDSLEIPAVITTEGAVSCKLGASPAFRWHDALCQLEPVLYLASGHEAP